jgi:hypothetical protein
MHGLPCRIRRLGGHKIGDEVHIPAKPSSKPSSCGSSAESPQAPQLRPSLSPGPPQHRQTPPPPQPGGTAAPQTKATTASSAKPAAPAASTARPSAHPEASATTLIIKSSAKRSAPNCHHRCNLGLCRNPNRATQPLAAQAESSTRPPGPARPQSSAPSQGIAMVVQALRAQVDEHKAAAEQRKSAEAAARQATTLQSEGPNPAQESASWGMGMVGCAAGG